MSASAAINNMHCLVVIDVASITSTRTLGGTTGGGGVFQHTKKCRANVIREILYLFANAVIVVLEVRNFLNILRVARSAHYLDVF